MSNDREQARVEMLRAGQDFLAMTATPGWERVVQLIEDDQAHAKEALLKVDPTDTKKIMELQIKAQQGRFLINRVNEMIKRFEDARNEGGA